ncbi:MAG: hypothetical protein HKN36_06345 [Hellea sp.]|nr:hypothetical protein [Hellea sp.]
MTKKYMILSTLLAIGITGCATSADDKDQPRGIAAYADDVRLGEQTDKICFTRNIDGFRSAMRNTVILDRGVNDEYIVEVMGGCQNLKWAQAIELDSNMSCLSKFDNLVVYDSAFGTNNTPGSVERCPIKSIHKWNRDAKEKSEDDGMKDKEELAKSPVK